MITSRHELMPKRFFSDSDVFFFRRNKTAAVYLFGEVLFADKAVVFLARTRGEELCSLTVGKPPKRGKTNTPWRRAAGQEKQAARRAGRRRKEKLTSRFA